MARERAGIVLVAAFAGATALVMTASACRRPSPADSAPAGPIHMVDATEESGVTFVHTDGGCGRRYIIEPMSGGLATFDYDLDGLIDVYFLNGAALPGTTLAVPPTNGLWRNTGGWRFEDRSQASGLADPGYGLGGVVGDVDNDGFPDVYLNNHGPNVLLLNRGDGTFADATAEAGVADGDLVGAGGCLADVDGDGDLDLYVGNYLRFDPDAHVQRSIDGLPSYPSPRDFQAVPDTLFRNDGDGRFTDTSGPAGVAGRAARAMGCIAADADDDGDPDVFVADDVDQNLHWINDGGGRFVDRGLEDGTAYNEVGDENAGMGVDCGDYDRDGLLDFFMTTYRGQMPVMYRNLGGGLFQDVTTLCGAGDGTYEQVKWGTGLVDLDNDGHLDIFLVNGHTEDNVERRDRSACYRCRNSVLANDGRGRFVNVTDRAGPGLAVRHSGRGAAFDDLDNDGDIDAVILNSRERPTLLENESAPGRHWLAVELEGTAANRDAVGARVRVMAGGLTQVAEVHAGRGYQGHFGSRLSFGLGDRAVVDAVEVRWPGGRTTRFTGIAADRRLLLREDGSMHVLSAPRR
ncbi:MAG: CRTAC1 family protein [Planctomycetia bacterium]